MLFAQPLWSLHTTPCSRDFRYGTRVISENLVVGMERTSEPSRAGQTFTLSRPLRPEFIPGSPPTSQLMPSNPFMVSRLVSFRFSFFLFQSFPQSIPNAFSMYDFPSGVLALEFTPSVKTILAKSRTSCAERAVPFKCLSVINPYPQRCFFCHGVVGVSGD